MTEEELLNIVVNDAIREYLDDEYLPKGGISCSLSDADEFVSRLKKLGYNTEIMTITPDPGDHDLDIFFEDGDIEEEEEDDCIVFFWNDKKVVKEPDDGSYPFWPDDEEDDEY